MHIKKSLTLLIIFVTSLLSWGTFFLVLSYLDPYEHTVIALSVLIICFILGISSLMWLWIYFFKKIYYRWDVYLFHVINSFRQGFFVSLFLLWTITFKIIGAPFIIASLALAMLFTFLELFIQDLAQ